MAKEKVFIVLSHKHVLKNRKTNDWEVVETVEFVNQLRNRHYTMSSAIGDYLSKKMITGSKVGMGDYEYFEAYVRKKYGQQMSQLDAAYGELVPQEEKPDENLIVDSFGNVRTRTVFDPV